MAKTKKEFALLDRVDDGFNFSGLLEELKSDDCYYIKSFEIYRIFRNKSDRLSKQLNTK